MFFKSFTPLLNLNGYKTKTVASNLYKVVVLKNIVSLCNIRCIYLFHQLG